MAVQSFNLPVDFLNNLEKPIIYIAKKDKTFLGAVSIYDDLSLTFNLNAYQTASFKIYRDINGNKYEHYDDFQEDRLIMIQGISWYKIHVETNIENTGISKSITANSLECTLCNKRLIDFECNTGEILYDDYVKTIFYDPTNPKGSLLHRVLNVAPSWSVGHVDATLANKQRSFDEDDIDIYSFLTGDVSEAFNCLFVFDTFNMTINAYDLDNYGEDTNIYVSMDNLAQSMTESIDENSIITCYRVNGGDGIYINEVNPNSTNKIYNFEYYLPEMEESIQNKVKAYNEKYQSLKPQYEEIMKRLGDQIGVIQELETRLPDSLDSKDWTKYGLDFLDSKVKSFKNIDEVYCAQGMNKPNSFNYNLYQQNLEDLNNVTAEYNKRKSEVDSATDVYNSIIAERNAVQSQLDMDKWFTKDEWKTLDSYVVEETYSNDNYITTDNTTDTERFDIERQLFDVAWKDLSKKCRPQYQYSSTLSNVLTIPQFKGFLKYFQLGNFIRMATDYDTVIKLRLISFTVDYNDTSKIDVTFSDAIRVHDIYEDASSIQAQANSAAMSFQFNKDQYDKSVNQSNFVEEMRKYGLDVANIPVKNQHQSWDETGMWFRQWNEQKNDFDPEQIKIINNQIVFSDDGFKSAKMAIGKIPIDKNGNTVYAVNAEAILGKLFLGEYLTLQNNSGTYKFDDDGFIAKGGNNSVRIQPNQSGELFSIYKGNNKQFYVDSDGNVHFTGDLTGSSGIFSGQLKGGSINLGNGTFMVDKNGNVFANNGTFGGNCTFKGTLDGADGSFSGKVNASSGTIGGWNIGETSLYSGYINTSIGYMNAVLSPGGLSFDLLGQNNTMIINALNIGWDSNDLCSLIKRDSITTQELSLKQLNFIMLSNPKITCPSGYLTFDTTNNVHFKNTPYIDNYSSYLAREEWCNDKFALKTDLSGYTTNSHLEDRLDDIKSWVRNNYATKSWCNSTFKKK
nr:MAG TPA: tail protein [Caudoviricetes sp.]